MVHKVTHIQSRWWRLFLLVVGLCWLLSGQGYGAGAVQQTVTLEAYLSAIAQYRGQILRAGNDAAQCRETMTAVAHALSQMTAVQFPDGSIIRVNHEGAAQALQPQPCNAARADQYLSGLCPSQLCAITRPLSSSPSAGNVSSGHSLAGAAVAGAGSATAPGMSPPDNPSPDNSPPGAPSVNVPGGEAGQPMPDQATDGGNAGTEIADQQSETTESLPGETGTDASDPSQPPALATTIAGNPPPPPTAVPAVTTAVRETSESEVTNNRRLLLLVALVVAVGLIVAAVILLLWQGAEAEPEPEEKESSQAMTAVHEGRQLVEKGDYREAARRLFLAMLLILDEKGALRFDRNRTNLELLQQERVHKAIIPSLTPIIVTYERVWYGLEPLPMTEYERLASEIKAIREWGAEI